MSKKIVFCGGGNMAEGIMRGLLQNGVNHPEDITVNELVPNRCEYLTKTYGVTATRDAEALIKEAHMVIIAVNPPQVPTVAKMLKPLISKKTIIMSIAAGVTISSVENIAGSDKKVVRVMPNTLNQSGDGYSAASFNENCTEQDQALVDEVLNALGQVMHIREEMFNTFTAFSNVGPMWLYKMTAALIDAGVYIGFSRTDARNIAIKNMAGVAGVLEITGEHPAVKVDQMTSPGGTTIEGLRVLQEEGFSTAIMKSVIASFEKVNAFE